MLGVAFVAVVVAALPSLLGWLATPAGGAYLGYQYATDDHMVYAAWMRQAMDGRFLFDNRFTTDPQPGLTVNIYFFLLGLVAKVVGIAGASTLARLGLGLAFVVLAHRLIGRLELPRSAARLALVLTVVGGGIGFLVWHRFGEAIVLPSPLSGVMLGRLPTDVWQPEGFVFPSMLTNGLFMGSLCLLLVALTAYLDARSGWRAVPAGAAAIALLMNVHSYDVLLAAFVLAGFAVACGARGQLTAAWVGRAAVITLGVLPAALWFAHVLRSDAVFQARAATETFSPNFRPILFGYLPLIGLGLVGMAQGLRNSRVRVGLGLVVALLAVGFFASPAHASGYFLAMPAFAVALLFALAAVALLATERPGFNLLLSWAVVGTVAIYFPGLFQRKLAMGLAIPWAVLAGLGLDTLLRRLDASPRRLATGLCVLILGASSVRWLARELDFLGANASRTSVHSVFLTPNMTAIVAALNGLHGHHVVAAPPGIPAAAFGAREQETAPKDALTPILPDLNPIVSGLAGVYTYAGHWSETPKYNERRGEIGRLFFGRLDPEARRALLARIGADYVIAPVPEAFPEAGLFDFRAFGSVVVDGDRFRLIKVR